MGTLALFAVAVSRSSDGCRARRRGRPRHHHRLVPRCTPTLAVDETNVELAGNLLVPLPSHRPVQPRHRRARRCRPSRHASRWFSRQAIGAATMTPIAATTSRRREACSPGGPAARPPTLRWKLAFSERRGEREDTLRSGASHESGVWSIAPVFSAQMCGTPGRAAAARRGPSGRLVPAAPAAAHDGCTCARSPRSKFDHVSGMGSVLRQNSLSSAPELAAQMCRTGARGWLSSGSGVAQPPRCW
jgi:hypothetical protein